MCRWATSRSDRAPEPVKTGRPRHRGTIRSVQPRMNEGEDFLLWELEILRDRWRSEEDPDEP